MIHYFRKRNVVLKILTVVVFIGIFFLGLWIYLNHTQSSSPTIFEFVVLFIFVFLTIPWGVLELILLVKNRKLKYKSASKPIVGRKVMINITTNGGASSVVNQIIKQMREYSTPLKFIVTIEEGDKNGYNADEEVIVPKNYVTPNHSLYKSRALHYFSQWLDKNGYGKETYVIHLDDDSMISEEYVKYVMGMKSDAGQGSLRLREYGQSTFSTLADFGRSYSCDVYCAYGNQIGKPIGVHGEGLVIRADIEAKIGWDFIGNKLDSEDYLMGQTIVHEGYSFDYIPGGIFISPPVTTRDFYKQRRRWMHSFFNSRDYGNKLNKESTTFFTYQYSMGWTVAFGFTFWMYMLTTHVMVPIAMDVVFTLAILMSYTGMLYGIIVNKTPKRWIILMIVLLIPVMLYQSGTFFYTILCPPKTYDVIRKV